MGAKKDKTEAPEPTTQVVGQVSASSPEPPPVVGRIVDAPDKPDASSIAQVQEL